MQHAQPLLFSHFLLAHAEAFLRDLERLTSARAMADSCPMGAGALGGSAFPIDREALARELGFARISANSLDAVGDRDFALDYLYALSTLANASLAVGGRFCSVRVAGVRLHGAAGRIFDRQQSHAAEKKSGCLGIFARQDGARDGSTVIAADHAQRLAVELSARFAGRQGAGVRGARPGFGHGADRQRGGCDHTSERDALKDAASDDALLATEAAHYLVRRGLPFRQAHEAVGHIIREAERRGVPWASLPLAELKKFSTLFESDLQEALTVKAALESRDVAGGTAPDRVRHALGECRSRLAQWEARS